MKKVIAVHLGNSAFQIEEDAYLYLSNFLKRQNNERKLEFEVAEILSGMLSLSKSVINFPDVVSALYELGFSASEMEAAQIPLHIPEKRLYRQPNGKMIAGVCTGLGDYFNADPVFVRVIFLVGLLLGTLTFWAYLAIWLIAPNAPKALNK